ncbi:MAG TPA: TRAP transporter small permease subunit [Stellaceae bacterium]|nr:TRAP transporter small permease subunit [Stellaceae bacterium]
MAATIAAGRWVVVPVSLLLFLQWPLRDLVWSYSSQANDLAQWLFALYVSLAMTYATRERAHLAADAFAERYAAPIRGRIARVALSVCVVPWSLFVLIAGTPMVWRSVAQLEAFPETYNPGYFIIKASALLLAALVLIQALLDMTGSDRRG